MLKYCLLCLSSLLLACPPAVSAQSAWRDLLAQGRRALEAGHHAGAEALLVKASHLAHETDHRGHVMVEPLRNLARAYASEGRLADSERVLRSVVEIWQRSFGPDHPGVAGRLRDVAEACRQQKKTAETLDALQRAATVIEKTLGPEQPAVALTVARIADAHRDSGDGVAAAALYRRAIQTLANTLGPESPPLADVMSEYAALLKTLGQPVEAGLYAARAKNIRERRSVVHNRGITPPRIQHKTSPPYSPAARSTTLQGMVTLYVEITAEGLPDNIWILEPLGGGLDQQAIEAVRQWRFQPAFLENQPVKVASTIEMNFRLL